MAGNEHEGSTHDHLKVEFSIVEIGLFEKQISPLKAGLVKTTVAAQMGEQRVIRTAVKSGLSAITLLKSGSAAFAFPMAR